MTYNYYLQATFHGYQLIDGIYDDLEIAVEEGDVLEDHFMTWQITYLQLEDTDFTEIESKVYSTPPAPTGWIGREDTTLMLVESEGSYTIKSDKEISFKDIEIDKWRVFVDGEELALEEQHEMCAVEICKGELQEIAR